MQCYTELTPPTAVTHALAIPLLGPKGVNLVVAKSSLLQIFATKVVATDPDNPQDGSADSKTSAILYDTRIGDDDVVEALGGEALFLRSDRSNNTKLVLFAEFPLAGTVTGLARIKTRNTRTGGDSLLIAFKDARLSLVEWDPERHDLYTVSIHYYEQDDLQGSPWAPALNECVNFLAADPGSRCAALKFGARNLAILPFVQPDEDIDMEGWDEDLDGPRPAKDLSAALVNGGADLEETPYAPSFVLRLSNLDPTLLHPVHLAFLHEYREPTFGIITSSMATSQALGRKDHLSYMVFTLDLQQKASTTILSVGGLPGDLFRVMPMPAPLGGALLIGTNELIHIDQSGRANGVAVNPLTKQSTSFALADQSSLNMQLEGCTIGVISPENGELFIVLRDGRLALINFRIDGRTIGGLVIRFVSAEAGGSIVPTGVTCITRIGRNAVFAGSQDCDSMVIGWSRKQEGQASRRKSQANETGMDFDLDDEDFVDEDDIYADEGSGAKPGGSGSGPAKGGELLFRVHDKMPSIAPIRDMTYGKPTPLPKDGNKSDDGLQSNLQLACAVGRGRAGSIALINREISPKSIGRFEFPEARGIWTMCVAKPLPKALQGEKGADTIGTDFESPMQYDKFMIVAKEDIDSFESSDVYAVTAAGFETLTGTEFEPAAGFTVEAGTMGRHSRIIQVLKSEVRCYDGDLGLAQILPMMDEETGAEPRVVSASIADPYLLLIRDDSSVAIAGMNKDHELEELDKEDNTLASTKWLTGCLFTDPSGVFAGRGSGKVGAYGKNVTMFLLSAAGTLYIYALPNLSEPVYVTDGLSYVPPMLSSDYAARRGTTKETLTEILVTDLGDTTSKSPYLILRHANDDLTLYEPLRVQTPSNTLAKSLRFKKIPNPTFAKSPAVAAQDSVTKQRWNMPLRACANVGGYCTVFLPGASPSFIMKSSKSIPRVIGLQGSGVRALSTFHTEGCERGFIYADSEDIARVCQLPADTSYGELGVCVQKIPLDLDVGSVAFHPPTGVYAVGYSVKEEFDLPKDDNHRHDWAKENIAFKPMVERGSLRLINPVNWGVIDTVEMESREVVMCVKTVNLEVSEATNERRQLIAVGTAISKGEDLAIKGRVYVYDVVAVIPQPGRPETNKRLKMIGKEEIPRGAVTALSEIGTQGLMLVAQGQKCLVRGLKEDGTLLPVAFMDMNCYVTSAKELPGTGLCVMADAFKGVWFTGYTEEPYRMMLFGKSNTKLQALNVDLLPDGKDLYIMAADADGNIHVLQFDPEHPKSLQGHLLLHRTTFSTGAHTPTLSLLVPTTSPTTTSPRAPDAPPKHHLLLASPTGLLATLANLAEADYRRLSTLAAQLATSLKHTAALNPKGHRAGSTAAPLHPPAVDAAVGRAVVDGAQLARWAELGAGRRADVAGRVGFAGPLEVRAELEALGWRSMAYF